MREVLRELSEAQILENRARVRKHMIDVHGADLDEHGRVGMMVSADGSWPIRGFSSASGQGALIYEDGDAFPPTIVAQARRGKYCAKCHWYETVEPTWVCPVHECPRNWTDSSKSMEADILVNLVEEVGRWEAEVDDGSKVPIPMDRRLVIEDVCVDEDSSFSVRLMDGSILEQAPAPRKRSDVNHLSNCLFRRFKTYKASHLKGTSYLSNPVVNCLCERYRWCVKENKGNPERARRRSFR